MKAMELVAQARSKVQELSVEELEQELAGGALLIDLREPDERETAGRIAGAVHVPRGMLEFRADPTTPYHQEGLDPNRRTILHCATGGRSALAAVTLRQLGYSDVAHLAGGIKAWMEAGRPIER